MCSGRDLQQTNIFNPFSQVRLFFFWWLAEMWLSLVDAATLGKKPSALSNKQSNSVCADSFGDSAVAKASLKLEILLVDIPGFQSPLQMLRRNRTSISLLAPLKISYNCSTVTRLLHFPPWYSTVTWVRDELPQGW